MTTEQSTLPKGIRRKPGRTGFDVYISVGRKAQWKYFAADTPIETMVAWRVDVRLRYLAEQARIASPLASVNPPERLPECGFVYFIRAGQRVKIGKAKNLSQRLEELQTAHADDLQLVAFISTSRPSRIEAALHKEFYYLRLRGEWFALDAELRALIERHAARNLGTAFGTKATNRS